MFCCKKRKARKAAKAQAVVSSLAAVESALEGKTAEMFAEKLTGNKKALKKARKATAKTVRAAEKELARIERNGRRRSLQRSSSRGGSLEERISVPASFFSETF